jgi:hypothetical protein
MLKIIAAVLNRYGLVADAGESFEILRQLRGNKDERRASIEAAKDLRGTDSSIRYYRQFSVSGRFRRPDHTVDFRRSRAAPYFYRRRF